MTDKLEYDDLPTEATEFKGHFSYIRARHKEYLEKCAKELEADCREFYGDGVIGCDCEDNQ